MVICDNCDEGDDEFPAGKEIDSSIFAGLGGQIHYISTAGLEAAAHPTEVKVYTTEKPHWLEVRGQYGAVLGGFYYTK